MKMTTQEATTSKTEALIKQQEKDAEKERALDA